jgi:DNA repair protein RecN (Recombination protein N)
VPIRSEIARFSAIQLPIRVADHKPFPGFQDASMLARLSIRDIVLIDRVDIDFAEGLSVLTGETGAGKSILLDAFALALGARGDAALVRHGAKQGQVTASFEVPAGHAVHHVMTANDIPVEDELILRRVQFADGRTRAFVNDQPVNAQTQRALGAALVEIHGQHDERALLDAASHRGLLDAFGGLEDRASEVERFWQERRKCETELSEQGQRLEQAQREADWLRHAVAELTSLAPQPSEESVLAERRTTMMQAEKVAGDLRDAHEAVAGAPAPMLSAALRRLERRRSQAPGLVGPAVTALEAALRALDEARGHLDAALRAGDLDPQELEKIEERLFALRAASRKYNVAVDELNALAARYAADLALIDAGSERLAQLKACAQAAAERYRETAGSLSSARRNAAEKLDQSVRAELKPLRLDRARFFTEITTDLQTGGPHGIDRAEFWVQTNPGTRPGPMMKVASGGELARLLLALKVVLADRGSAPTLIFDEIDTGVGGAVADAIGVRLARLARRAQVIAVTHAPQVAARADRHYLISKGVIQNGKRVSIRVAQVAAEKRREEIARMLAGAEITAEARAAAERLIKAAS